MTSKPGADPRIPTPDPVPAETSLNNATREALRRELSWLPEGLFNIYYANWIKTGDAALALDAMRQAPAYDTYFAGNRREDGSLRWSEQQYLTITEGYADTLRLAGVNPDLLRHRFGDLVEGNKSPDEFASQVQSLVERVSLDAPEVLAAYSDLWGINMTLQGLIASALDPDLSDAVLNQQITMAEITAEGMQSGFKIDKEFAASLFNADLNETAASDFFGAAGQWVPALNVLARRHADPDDEFDLESFAASEIFDDPVERMRMRRLVAQERASFITSGGFGVQTSQTTGGLSGLGNR